MTVPIDPRTSPSPDIAPIDPQAPIPAGSDPRDLVNGYESDPAAAGTGRTAAPPDGIDQDWTVVHPNGSREVLGVTA